MKSFSFLLITMLYFISVATTLIFPTGLLSDVFFVIASLLSLFVIFSIKNKSQLSQFIREQVYGWIFILFLTVYLIFDIDKQSLKTYVSSCSVVIAFFYYSKYGYLFLSEKNKLISCFLLVSIMLLSLLVDISKNIQGGVFFYATTLLLLINIDRNTNINVKFVLFFTVNLLVAVTTNFRSLVIYILILLLIFFVLSRIKSKAFEWFSFRITVLSILLGVFVYANIGEFNWFDEFNSWAVDNTGRQIVSGRQEIWPVVLSLISEKTFFGSGLSASYSLMNTQGLSEHNFYLSLAFKTGVVGLMLFYLWLSKIWKLLSIHSNGKRSRVLGMSLFITFIMHNSLEVLMLYNGTVAGILAWITIASCLSISRSAQHEC